jgi:cytochrome c peroxidase
MKRIFIIGLAYIALAASENLFLIPEKWPQPVYNFEKNPLTANKILLGRTLFYDPVLSRNGIISCASCHSPFSSFTHIDHALSHGINDSIGTRNSPALVNLAWQKTFMWDAAINNLDMQALAPISHPAEMGSSIKLVVEKLQSSKIYPELYRDAFGDTAITGARTLSAISQFMLTLVSDNSKYDKMMRHEAEFTTQELNGYKLFRQHCSSCHKEPLFTTGECANNGLKEDSILKDTGRMKITMNSSDSLKFKIPTLRNVEYSYPYMHDGRFKRLSDVINHYTSGIVASKTLAPELKTQIVLSSNEKVDLISFLLTLSDREFVFNPKFQYPREVFNQTIQTDTTQITKQ